MLIQNLSCRGCFNPMGLRTVSILPRISSQSPQRCPSDHHTVGSSWPQGPWALQAGQCCWPSQLLLSLSSPWRRGLRRLLQGIGVATLALPLADNSSTLLSQFMFRSWQFSKSSSAIRYLDGSEVCKMRPIQRRPGRSRRPAPAPYSFSYRTRVF